MIDPITIDFAIRGLADVSKAFESVEQRVTRFEKAASKAADVGSKARVKSASEEAKQTERAAAKARKAVEREDAQKTRSAEVEARRRQGIVRKSSEMAGRYAGDLARQEARSAQEATRAIEREEDRKTRIRLRAAELSAKASVRAATAEIAAQKRVSGAWGQRGRRVGGIVAGSVGGVLSGAGAIVGGMVGIGGGMMLADAARKEMSAERQAALLVNTVTTGNKPPAGANIGAILGQAGQISRELGVDKTDIVSGALEYARKARGGDFAGVKANMGFFAEMSKVTGADISDIAGAAGTLQSQNQDLKGPEMQQMLLDVYAQGKAGSMSMVDVSKQMGNIASTRSAFQGSAAVNQRKLLGLAQLAAPEGSIEEAGTYVKDLSMALSKPKHVETLKAMGVKMDSYGAVESPENLIDSVFRGTKGDITKISGIFGARGVPLFRGLEGAYKGAGGGEAGIAAVNAQMASVTGATMSIDQLHAQNAQIDSSAGQKFQNAMNRITEDLQGKLAPRMEHFAEDTLPKLVDKFEWVIDEASKFADWFADNPIKGVGSIVLAAITKDLADAAITAAAKEGIGAIMAKIASMIGSGGGGGVGSLVPGAGGSGAMRNLAAAGAIAAISVGVTQAGMSAIDSLYADKQAKQSGALGNTLTASNTAGALRAKVRAGNVTPADIAAAQAQATALGTQGQEQKNDVDRLRGAAATPILGALAAPGLAAAEGASKNTTMAFKQLTEAITLAAVSLKAMGTTAANTDLTRRLPISERPSH